MGGVKFFGQFLIEKGAITREGLLKALELQERTNLRFGETALAMGILTREEIEKVHEAQKSEDLRFGDMAVRIGVLTPAQAQQVLTRQKNSHLFLGQALVETGALDAVRVDRYLEEFKLDQAPFQVETIVLPEGVPKPELWEIAADLTYKLLARIASLPNRPGKPERVQLLEPNDTVAAIDFRGSASARYLLTVSAGLRESIARAILKEPEVGGEPIEVLEDAVLEFINIVAGNVAAKAAQLGHSLDLCPPEILEVGDGGLAVPDGRLGVRFPIHVVSSERMELALFVDNWGI